MAGDVLGVYKSVDHGRNWRIINNGLTNYGVYSLAVDPPIPTPCTRLLKAGFIKVSMAAKTGALPHTGRKELRITGERGISVRSIAVDPTNGNNLYAASPVA